MTLTAWLTQYYVMLLRNGWQKRLIIDRPALPPKKMYSTQDFLLNVKIAWWMN